jgi:hypothetical protein
MSDVFKKAVSIYSFHDAPKEWQALSPFGGDEDWIVVADGDEESEDEAEYIAGRLEICASTRVKLPDGRVAFITCHS